MDRELGTLKVPSWHSAYAHERWLTFRAPQRRVEVLLAIRLDRLHLARQAAMRGYGEFLNALADPVHEGHAGMKEWVDEDFNPEAVAVTGQMPFGWFLPREDAKKWGRTARAASHS